MDDCHIIGSAEEAQTHAHTLASVGVQSVNLNYEGPHHTRQ